MTESLQNNGLWHITLVEEDLINQAGFKRQDFEQDFGFFRYKQRKVIISHIYGEHLVVSMEGKDDKDLKEFVGGLSKVVRYKPFCKYLLSVKDCPELPTYEWDKIAPKARYEELGKQSNVSDLVKLKSFWGLFKK
jgi:hypothetical protein